MSESNNGCTFVDWSVLYLSGQDQFYSFKTGGYRPLVSNPVTAINAHGHEKNHAPGFEKNQTEIQKFLHTQSGLLTLYPRFLSSVDAAKNFNVDIDSPEFASNIDTKFKDFLYQDLKKLWFYLHEVNAKIIWVENDPNLMVAHLNRRSTDNSIKDTGPASAEELDQEFQDLFYASSKKTWAELNLTNVWDERERRALDLRVKSSNANPENTMPFELPHLQFTNTELWTQGESVIQRVMKFCELEIQQDRWQSWLSVHKQWQSRLSQEASFCFRLPTILKSIVNGWYYDMGELTFMQEVAIQHFLIYKHNLNLKTWELSKFPRNAQDLHKLLEPNIHSVPNIYNS